MLTSCREISAAYKGRATAPTADSPAIFRKSRRERTFFCSGAETAIFQSYLDYAKAPRAIMRWLYCPSDPFFSSGLGGFGPNHTKKSI
jgi:hypothetical protein